MVATRLSTSWSIAIEARIACTRVLAIVNTSRSCYNSSSCAEGQRRPIDAGAPWFLNGQRRAKARSHMVCDCRRRRALWMYLARTSCSARVSVVHSSIGPSFMKPWPEDFTHGDKLHDAYAAYAGILLLFQNCFWSGRRLGWILG